MVEYDSNIDEVFKAISDPIRRNILSELRHNSKSVKELASNYNISFAGVSKHIQLLMKANLIQQKKKGRERICNLNAKPLTEVQDWLNQYTLFWENRLDILNNLIENIDDE